MPSIMTLEGARAGAMPRLWTPSESPQGLAGDNAVVTWMKAQPLPVAIGASIALSLGVGFIVSTAFIKLIGKGGSSKAVAGARRERIPGGKAAGRSPKEFDQRELAKGIKVEMEHTRSKRTAREIAMDHLAEEPHYYSKLARTGLRGTKTDPALAALLKGQRDGLAGKSYAPPATHVEKYRQGFNIGTAHRKAKGLAGAKGARGLRGPRDRAMVFAVARSGVSESGTKYSAPYGNPNEKAEVRKLAREGLFEITRTEKSHDGYEWLYARPTAKGRKVMGL